MYNPLTDGLPEGYADCLHTKTEIVFDWKDRLRILFGAKVSLKCRTYCENIPGKVYSESSANVWIMRRRSSPAEAEVLSVEVRKS